MAALKRSALITGCSAGGIGEALALVFHEKGFQVFATVRNPAKISSALSNAGNVHVLTLDVTSSESIAAAVKSVAGVTGDGLDVLVNNSGGTILMPSLDTSIVEAKKVFDVNYWGPMAMLQAFAPLLIKSKGCVVNNTSANAYVPMPLMGIYNASKAALAAASETWRLELQPLDVRVITLVTCAVKTNFFENYHAPEVPETSHYVDIRYLINKVASGELQNNAITPRQYANKVVGEIDKGTAGTVWAGTDALVNRLGLWLSPQFVLDMMIEKMIPIKGQMAQAKRKRRE